MFDTTNDRRLGMRRERGRPTSEDLGARGEWRSKWGLLGEIGVGEARGLLRSERSAAERVSSRRLGGPGGSMAHRGWMIGRIGILKIGKADGGTRKFVAVRKVGNVVYGHIVKFVWCESLLGSP